MFTQFGLIGFWIFVNSMKADACDWDELSSGRRREGVYGAIGNLIQKRAASLIFVIAGVILQGIGYDAALKGAQSPDTIFWLRVIFSALPIALLVPCLLLLDRYPLGEHTMRDVRAKLEQRRAAV